MSETMNDFEKQLLEELKFNVSSDSLRRKKKDNAEIRALSLVRHNCVDWLKIDKKETVLDLGGAYGDLCGSIAPRCRKLYISPIDEAHQAIIEERIKALKNAETADIEEILNNKKIKINRAIIHDLPLVFKDREELFEMISTLMDKGIGKIAVLCDCPESWRSHLNISMKNKEKDEIRKKYSDLCLIPEEVTAGIRMPEGYHKAVFSALPDNTFVRAVAKENADTYEGTSFTMLLEKEETPYDEVYRFSNDRAERYSLKTVISSDKVSKTACGIYSIDFLFRMLKIGKELNRQYPDKWQCIPCHREKDALVFDTAKGESLRDMLVRFLGERNEEEYFSLIKEYCEFIRNSHGISYFCPSERFREMFGDVKGLEECLSGTLNNIDLTFDNIIVNKDQRTVIDYEWVFDYPIPREYIMYRAVFYFYKELPDNGYYRKMKKETLRIFTIDKKQEKAFMDMEEHFQEAIMGGLKRSYTINWSL